MARLKEKVAAEKILGEYFDNLMGVLNSKPDSDGLLSSDNGVSDAADDVDTENMGVENSSSEGFGGTSVAHTVVDGRVALEGSSNVSVARDQKVSECDFSCTDTVGSNGKRGGERGIINLNADVNVDGMGVGRWNGERLEDQDHGFRVGDFVWGQVKRDPWWPGQVCDPRDASEFALKHSQEGRVLVAFFGDGSCSWCLPSQLKPFVENIDRILSESSSNSFQTAVQRRSFLNAVQRAVDEIGRLVESKITCRCMPSEKRGHLARPIMANAGVKAGVLMPEVDIDRLAIPEYEPAAILAKVVGFAKTVCFDSLFELAVLKSWMSVYSYAKCGGRLCVYGDPVIIEGLEDSYDKVYDLNVSITMPIHGPEVDDSISSPKVGSAKSQAPSDDKIYQRRKQKSVVQLMTKKNVVKPKTRKRSGGEVERGGSEGGSKSGKRGRKGGSKSGKRGRKLSAVVFDTAEETDGLTDDALVVNESEDNVEVENGSSSRERKKKKSKYLSPPFTSLGGKKRYFDELTVEKNRTRASQEQDFSTFEYSSDMDDKASIKKELDETDNKNSEAAKNEKKMTFSASDVDREVHDLFLKLESAALDPFYLRKEGHLDSVWAFISAYRSATFLHGSDYKIYNKCKKMSRKRKSLGSPPSSKRRGCSLKIYSLRKRPAGELGSSQPTDDLVSDARVIRKKLDKMTKILGSYGSRFSSDDKSCLKDEMQRLAENVETASEMVRLMAENTSS